MSDCVLYPAIDLLGGRCVRLTRGEYDQARVFDDDPVRVARRWRDDGATWLHIVDLDGARDGQPRHLPQLRAIAAEIGLPIQYSGGLRTREAVETALASGAARVTLGTAAVQDRPLLRACLARWSDRIAVSLDARGGRLAIDGWLRSSSDTVEEFAALMVGEGVSTLVVTSVDRDGTLAGADDSLLGGLRRGAPSVRLLGGGGVASLDDVRRLAGLGLDGIVLGKALYQGAFTLDEARRVVEAMREEDATC